MWRFPAVGRLASRISVRMLAFNLLLVFLPAAGFLYLDVYERQLLRAQEHSMVQQGRILAAALSEREGFGADDAEDILLEMGQRITARIRVLDSEGRLLADSSQLGPRREPGDDPAVGQQALQADTDRAFTLSLVTKQDATSRRSPTRPCRCTNASRARPRRKWQPRPSRS